MDKNHIIAWACGIFAALLVIMAGKSCMKIPEKPEKNNTTEAATLNDFELNLGTGTVKETEPKVIYDEFGRPIKATEAAPEEETQVYTDEFGNVIEPPTEIFTDEFGNIIEPPTDEYTEPQPQYATDLFGNATDETIPPATVSNEENVEEADTEEETAGNTIPPGFSGYDHGKYDKDGNPMPTIPPDFKIVIE